MLCEVLREAGGRIKIEVLTLSYGSGCNVMDTGERSPRENIDQRFSPWAP